MLTNVDNGRLLICWGRQQYGKSLYPAPTFSVDLKLVKIGYLKIATHGAHFGNTYDKIGMTQKKVSLIFMLLCTSCICKQ